ncbi:sigma-70 family RNA polymerase sigma factor [Pedobacter yonginense]|uniref:Sigma-70 family RNA polymerase sigma factor n=1 Tax=Pedobacter yonginense TaxID=651869 RepID=A0A317EHR5_9SPHI|nr:sigma-70 family RNA polymerase sigma factor [Pedobacter yonginense]PWS26351.1 sigma-70 family RNA polymerase sigma factor [Pedobacter yonginense]
MSKSSSKLTDAEIIDLLSKQNFDNEAVKALYLNNFTVLSGYILQNQGSEQDAEDIFQEVIVRFIEIVRAGKFRGESSIRTFLFSLNRFSWLNELRKRNKSLLRENSYQTGMGEIEPDVSRFIINREDKAIITNTIDLLGAVCKKILLAYYYENLTMKEILKLVEFESEQALRNKKYKCMKSLEQLFAKDPSLAKKFKAALTYE